MLRSVQSKDYIKFSLAAIEKGIALCRQRAQESGLAFEQMVKSENNLWFEEIRIFNNQNYSEFLLNQTFWKSELLLYLLLCSDKIRILNQNNSDI